MVVSNPWLPAPLPELLMPPDDGDTSYLPRTYGRRGDDPFAVMEPRSVAEVRDLVYAPAVSAAAARQRLEDAERDRDQAHRNEYEQLWDACLQAWSVPDPTLIRVDVSAAMRVLGTTGPRYVEVPAYGFAANFRVLRLAAVMWARTENEYRRTVARWEHRLSMIPPPPTEEYE